MKEFQVFFGQLVHQVTDWFTTTFAGLFDVITAITLALYGVVEAVLSTPPFWVIALAICAIAYLAKGWKLALGTLIGVTFIFGVGQWENAMASLALVIIASAISLIIAIPLGILAARNQIASATIRPVLDLLQTMPAFVYLIPALTLFGIGVVPGIAATILFALAPGVRLTELGIRSVDYEVVEAGYAFGSTPGKVLRQIQLPLAMPSIMAGVNQVIMMSLSMVVVAGMVGAGGLGSAVVASLSRIDIVLGFKSGLSVVVLAMILDRITGGFAAKKRKAKRKGTSAPAVDSDARVQNADVVDVKTAANA